MESYEYMLTLNLPAPVIAQEATGAGVGQIGLLVLMFVAFYFLFIRPQQKRVKAQRQLVSSLEVGDEVIVGGGIHATIRALEDEVMHAEVAPGTTITVERHWVSRRITEPGDISAGDDG